MEDKGEGDIVNHIGPSALHYDVAHIFAFGYHARIKGGVLSRRPRQHQVAVDDAFLFP